MARYLRAYSGGGVEGTGKGQEQGQGPARDGVHVDRIVDAVATSGGGSIKFEGFCKAVDRAGGLQGGDSRVVVGALAGRLAGLVRPLDSAGGGRSTGAAGYVAKAAGQQGGAGGQW